ncbi:putative uncharacterized protein DDB_G0274435 [Hermetia illucens]|uniref:putative uncharacterized protein DDB_G0274435 n=1 Tax=Hermetia illucens TaxID=343691 RepID=UPI0018CC6F5E|nr:putative uncharacterized protein DDB_G0274435 [Hermetia illucens]
MGLHHRGEIAGRAFSKDGLNVEVNDSGRKEPAATQNGLGDRMSAKRSKVILPGEMSSEEEGSTGPEVNEVALGLQKEIADLKCERAAMAQQLECQQLLIKQLQQKLASLEETVRAGPPAVQQQRRHQQQQQQEQHQQHQEQHQQHQEQHQQQQQEQQEALAMDIVGSPAAFPEVIIDEDPFNFVRSRKSYKKSKTMSQEKINAFVEKDLAMLLFAEPSSSYSNDTEYDDTEYNDDDNDLNDLTDKDYHLTICNKLSNISFFKFKF